MSINPNNTIITDDERLRKIAFRMDATYHNEIIYGSEIVDNADGRKVPVNLLATHHHPKGGGLNCRLPLTYSTTGATMYRTGNCYREDKISSDCKWQPCILKCDSVLRFTKYCLDGDIGEEQSAYYGFLLLVLETAKESNNTKIVYDQMMSITDLAVSILHLYGYVENDNYIAFPVLIENDFANLVNKLKSYMRTICDEKDPSGKQKYEDKMFDEAKKAFSKRGHRFWKRVQWMFCEILIYLDSVHSSLKDEQKELFEKAKSTWVNGMHLSPNEWISNNPNIV